MEIFQQRRSCRKFTEESVEGEMIKQMKEVLLLAPTGRNMQTTKFAIVEDHNTIQQLQAAREKQPYIGSARLIIVILNDLTIEASTYIENASIAAAHLQVLCEIQKLGSCWIHLHDRKAQDGSSSAEYVRKVLKLRENLLPHCMIIIGHPAEAAKPKEIAVEQNERFV